MATNAMDAPSAGRAKLFSGWMVAGLLALHVAALTVIHYVVGPMLGISPASPDLIAATIVTAAVIVISFVRRDVTTADRRARVLAVLPQWNAATILTMVGALAISQIPLGIMALQGNTVWQMGAVEKLAIGQALAASGGASSIALVVATVLVAPAIEELLYRGYLLGALRERMPLFTAVLVSALLFVFVLHFEASNLVAAFCLGLGTGWCASRTSSFLPGFVVHAASNAFGLWYLSLAAV